MFEQIKLGKIWSILRVRELLLHHHSTYLLPLFWAPTSLWEHKNWKQLCQINEKRKASILEQKEASRKKRKNLHRLSELTSIDLAPRPPAHGGALRAQRVIPAQPQKWLVPSFMAQKQTMREEQPGEGSRPSHMASQPSSSVHTGPSARREETNKVRRWPVGLKAFLDRISVSKPVPAALCVILTGLSDV